MKKLMKKGFTIVELVIVIAVIAILTAVLIPTISSVTQKAQVSADTQLIRMLNTSLKADEAKNGKPKYMQQALDIVAADGFDVAKIEKAKAVKNRILWDSVSNAFCYLKDGELEYVPNSVREGAKLSANSYKLWTIASAPDTTYSTYLYNVAPGVAFNSVHTGVDVGNEKVASIEYIGGAVGTTTGQGQEVVIRTNGGTLTVNAASDTVNHYGEGLVLNIQAIAGSSYHEFGHFPKATIAQGRIVVEEDGNIPAVEITAVPTDKKPVKIETNKDVVVSASQAVVTELGDNNLDNVEVKVTSANATVVVDEKIDSSDVTINGQTASEEQLVSIKKVSSLSELLAALTAQDKYIMFSNDIATNGSDLINITYSVTIDGNGNKLTGNGGNRGSVKQMMCFGWEAPELIEKIVVKDLSIETTTVTRALECRGNTKEIIFDGVTLKASGSGNDQGFTFGGNYADLMKLTLKNSNFSVGGDGYTFIFFNAVDMAIENSTISGWAGLYFKSPSSSHGARGSKVYVSNSDFVCHNENWGATNAFGAIVFEDGDIDVTLVDSNLDVTAESDQEQCAILFSSGWANYFGTHLTNGHVIIKGNSSVNGSIDTALLAYDLSNDIKIEGGIFTSDPTDYLADGHTETRNGAMYVVK